MSTRFPVLVNNMLDSFFNDEFFRPVSSGISRAATSFVPALNVREFDNHYQIELSLPSIDPSQIKVEIEEKALNISYQEEKESANNETNPSKNDPSEGNFVRREWQTFSSFRRSVILSKDVDKEKIEAEYDRGVLTITVLKLPQNKPQSVDIKIKDNGKSDSKINYNVNKNTDENPKETADKSVNHNVNHNSSENNHNPKSEIHSSNNNPNQETHQNN